MKTLYYLIDFPEVQTYQMYEGFDDNSYMCNDIMGAYFVDKEWADEVDAGNVQKTEEYP